MSTGHEVKRLVVQGDLDIAAGSEIARSLAQRIHDIDTAPGPLRLLVSHLPLAAVAIDEKGTFVTAVGSALGRLGVEDGDLVGTPVEWWGEAAVAVVQSVNAGTPRVFDVDGVSNGKDFRFRCLAMPDGDGGSVGLVIDLTDVLEAEKAARNDRELWELAIEASGSAILLQDADGAVLSHNTVATEIFGRPLVELFDGGFDVEGLDAVHPDGRPFQVEDFPGQTTLGLGQPQRGITVGIRLPTGQRRWLNVSSFPIQMGERPAVMSSIIDTTERHLSEVLLRDSDERFRLLAERAPLGILILDRKGQVLYANPQAEEITGRAQPEIGELGFAALVHEEDRATLLAMRVTDDDEVSARDGFPVEVRVVRPDGEIRWVRARGATIFNSHGSPIGTVATAADITELRRADERLSEHLERTRSIVETAAEGIVTTDESGTIIEFNAAAERIFGYDSDEVIGATDVFTLLAMQDRERMRGHLRDYLSGAPPRVVGRPPIEIVGLRKDGTLVPIELALTESRTSEGRLFTGLIRDMSERKAFEQELEHLATHDPLTGLPNRALLTAQLESALARANRHETSVGVLFTEIDRVKLVTEALGHRAGDDLLLQVAARLRDTAGSSATVARFASDQFVVFIEDLDDVGDAVEVATRIIEHINEPFNVAGEEAFVNASVGIAFAPDGMSTAESLISNADVAMGRAKASSVTRYEVFDSDMRAWVEAQRKTEIALRHGIERDEFELHYQPVMALADSSITGFEALVRWKHPRLGMLPPNEFIPVAEDSGLIVPMGEWILRRAINQSAEWQAAFGGDVPLSVAINLSARQLAQPDLVAVVRSALDDVDVDPSTVAFEITETVLLEDVEAVEQTLTQLKDLGVQLSLDDFGTGYSSLTYLCRLPIDIVKVDRSFVSQLGTGTRDASIVEMIIGMARTLQLDVVAEGVETEEQAEILRSWGCQYAQGFLFSKPKPVDEVQLMLDDFNTMASRGDDERS